MSSTVCAQAVPARQAARRAREPGRECRSWAGRAGHGQGEQEMGREYQNRAGSARTGQGEPEPGGECWSWAGRTRTGQGEPEPGSHGQPSAAAGAAVWPQPPCQRFLSLLTACKRAPARLAWSISNPNGSVEVWKPIWQFYTQTLGMMKEWWKDNMRENMPDFASVDMALNLYWPGTNKLSPF